MIRSSATQEGIPLHPHQREYDAVSRAALAAAQRVFAEQHGEREADDSTHPGDGHTQAG
jgi:hypothetical protein